MSKDNAQATIQGLLEGAANGLSRRWRLALAGLLFVISAILAFCGWDVGARLLGVWGMLLSGIATIVLILFDFSKGLIGQKEDSKAGARSASVVLALLLAALASPEVISSTAKTMVAAVYTATVYTPTLVATQNAQIENAIVGIKKINGKPDEKVPPKKRSVAVDLYGNQANADLFTKLSELINVANKDTKADSAAWIWFFFVFAAVLFLARALVQSYDAMSPSEAKVEKADALEAPEPSLERKSKAHTRPSLMNYPKWLALCLYASILVPATYFSLGALLKLGLDSRGTEISTVQTQLRDAGATAMDASPGFPIDLDKIAGKLQRFGLAANAPPQANAQGQNDKSAPVTPLPADYKGALQEASAAISNARGLTMSFETWRAGYETAALRQATSLKRIATADQFSDHISAVSAQYRADILKARSDIRSCFVGLSDMDAGFGDKSPGIIQLQLAQNINKRCAKAKETVELTPRPPLPVVCSETCPAKAVDPKADAGCVACQGGAMSNVLYGWMADISDSAVLIVGLIGFGLFGAAIRMLGRPDDESIVTEADFTLARMEQAAAHTRLKEKGQTRLEAAAKYDAAKAKYDTEAVNLDPTDEKLTPLKTKMDNAQSDVEAAQKEENDARANASKADIALATLDRRAAEGRSNFVVERIEDGKREYVISGAPAKVMVSGLGAAFTVFLAGKAGVQILTEGGRTSPTGLLLACFVGAVFAENIWRAVSEAVAKRTTSTTPAS